jgi:ribosomal protein S18 acetylase RimI-like enzyme
VYLEVLPSNERALAIYRAIGFRQTGEAGLLVPMSLFAAGRRP